MQSLKRKSCKKGFKKIKVEFVRDDEILSGEQNNLNHAIWILDSKKSVANPFCFLLMIFFFLKKNHFFEFTSESKSS